MHTPPRDVGTTSQDLSVVSIPDQVLDALRVVATAAIYDLVARLDGPACVRVDNNADVSRPTASASLSVEAAAAQLGVGKSTIYEYCRRGRIPSFRLGRRIVIPADSFAEFMARESS